MCAQYTISVLMVVITISHSVTRCLGLPVTDHTYEDCRLMITAGELTLPMEAGLVEFTKISRKLEYDCIYYLKKYISLSKHFETGIPHDTQF